MFFNADAEHLGWWNMNDLKSYDELPPFIDPDGFPEWDGEYWFDSVNRLWKKFFCGGLTRKWMHVIRSQNPSSSRESQVKDTQP